MTPASANEFDVFRREAFDVLDRAGVRFLVIGGLAVVAVGEPRTTADVDVIAFLTSAGADALIGRAAHEGFELDVVVERRRLDETGTLRFLR